MINFNLILNNKFLLLFIIITFIISLYNLLKHVNNDKYESYNEIIDADGIPVKNLNDITEPEFNEYVRTVPNNTVYISWNIETIPSNNGLNGTFGILDDNTYVSNTDTNDFYLEFILYYSDSKDKSKFKPITIKKFKTNVKKLTANNDGITDFKLLINNINFNYYFIGIKLVPINKNYKITTFTPSLILVNIGVNKN